MTKDEQIEKTFRECLVGLHNIGISWKKRPIERKNLREVRLKRAIEEAYDAGYAEGKRKRSPVKRKDAAA